MSTHTPGPWKVEKQRAPNGGSYYRIYDQDDAKKCVAQVIGDGRIEYHENAHLIAAAPEMLAALRAALAVCEAEAELRGENDVDDYHGGAAGPVSEMIRAAIAHAEGQA